MEGRLHRRVLGPALAVAATIGLGGLALGVGLVARDQVGAEPPSSSAGAVASASASPEACMPRFRRFSDDPGRAAWFTLEQQTDTNGVLTGNVARVTRGGRGPVTAIELPPEAWADGPYDEGALVGSDDGLASTLRFLAPGGCGRTILTTADTIIWRATISPDGETLFTFHLARGTREPLGLWMAPVADPADGRQLLRPAPADDRFGITWGTSLHWSAEGDRLIVESCTPKGCRFQIIDPSVGREDFVDDDGVGDFVGLAGDRLFVLADCIDFRPCPLLERNLATGAIREVHPAAYDAWLVEITLRPALVVTGWDGERERIHVIDSETGDSRLLALPTLLAGFSPVRTNVYGSVGLPRGWIALAPDGRLPDGRSARPLFAIDIETSRLVMLIGGDS